MWESQCYALDREYLPKTLVLKAWPLAWHDWEVVGASGYGARGRKTGHWGCALERDTSAPAFPYLFFFLVTMR